MCEGDECEQPALNHHAQHDTHTHDLFCPPNACIHLTPTSVECTLLSNIPSQLPAPLASSSFSCDEASPGSCLVSIFPSYSLTSRKHSLRSSFCHPITSCSPYRCMLEFFCPYYFLLYFIIPVSYCAPGFHVYLKLNV